MTNRELLEKTTTILVQLMDCLTDTIEHLERLENEILVHLATKPIRKSQENSQKT